MNPQSWCPQTAERALIHAGGTAAPTCNHRNRTDGGRITVSGEMCPSGSQATSNIWDLLEVADQVEIRLRRQSIRTQRGSGSADLNLCSHPGRTPVAKFESALRGGAVRESAKAHVIGHINCFHCGLGGLKEICGEALSGSALNTLLEERGFEICRATRSSQNVVDLRPL